ncbi:MAG: PAS domain S-box protein [Anaerolineae bacterium]|nr:PAS domain S-box protein [Anaerolineae bacterium]
MSANRQDLLPKLATARQQLKNAQTQVVKLEALLNENQPTPSTSLVSEDRYHRLLDNLLEGAEIIGFDWRYLYVNDAVAGHGRQKKEVLLRSTVLELYPGIENTEMFAHFRTCMDERIPQHFEAHFIFPDGEAAWFELSVQPVPEGIFILSLDITERKPAEEALQESLKTLEQRVEKRTAELHAAKERVEAILNNSTDAILLVYTDLTIRQTNWSFNSLFACDPDDYFGKLLTSLVHEEEIDRVTKTLQATIVEKQSKSIEIRTLRKDGTSFDAELSIGHIKDDGLVCTIRDITERKAQERQLRYHANLQENVSDAVLVTDMEFRIQSWNKAAERIYGWSAEEVVGKATVTILGNEFLSPADREHSARQLFEQGWWQGEVSQHHKDGSIRHILGSVNLVTDENGLPFSIVAVNHNITERKRAEEALTTKLADEREFQSRLKALHEITIELTQIDQLDIFYKRVVELGLERLGFDRLALFLYDEQDGAAQGTYGTDSHGIITDERAIRFIPDPNAIMLRAFKRAERFYFDEQVPLYKDMESVGVGWNAASVLWNGTRSLGWLVADNLLHQTPASKPLMDILGLYSLTVGTLLAQKRTQLDLSDREERFRQYFELPLIGMALTSPDKGWIQVNDKLCEMLGYSRDELTQKTWIELTYPDDLAPDLEQFEQVLAGELDGYSIDKRYIRKDGQLIFTTVTIRAVRHADGRLNYMVGLMQDITDRKRAEATLRESEARYRLLAENITDVVMRSNAESEYIYVSASVHAVLGYEPEELLNQPAANYIHPDDLTAKAQATTAAIEQNPLSINLIVRFRHKQGHYIWLETIGRAIRSEKTGEIEGFISSSRDISDRKQAEEALRESEEKFRLLLDSAPVATIISDQMGLITLVNVQAENLFGFNRTELVGQMVEILVPDYVRDVHLHKRTTYMEVPHVRQVGMEVFARRKDTSEFPVEIELSYIETKNGIMVMSFVVDITERKQNAAALEQQRTFLRNVIDASPSMIFVKDYDARFVLVNRLAAQMYNATPDTLIGKTDTDFNPSLKEIVDFMKSDRHVIDSGEPLFLEEPLTNFAGETHWLQTTKVPIVSMDGKSKYVLGVSTDITACKQAENALYDQHEFLQLVINSVPGLIIVKDRAGRFQLVNNHEAELHGLMPADMLGKTDAEFNPNPDEVDFFVQKDRETLETGQTVFIPEETVLGRYYQTTKIPLKNHNGEYDRLLVVASDITERKKAEETLRHAFEKEKELGELKTRFVSMASHEFRTPLATILAITETLVAYRQRLQDVEIEQRLLKIQDQVGHLRDIMDDVLLLARMQARRTDFNPTRIDLDSLCRSVIDEFQGSPDGSQRLIYTCDERLYEVTLDKKLMRQMISNLVSNAVKYSSADSSITISLEVEDATLIFKIADQGIGIPEADLKHLFEPFHRAGNVGAISGTGLGMVITKGGVFNKRATRGHLVNGR